MIFSISICFMSCQEKNLSSTNKDDTEIKANSTDTVMAEQDFTSKPKDEPLFMAINSSSAEYIATIDEARETLDVFESLFKEHGTNPSVYFAFKVALTDKEGQKSYLWYSLDSVKDGLFYGEHFEIPPELSEHKSISRERGDIYDWMINDSGVLYGGFSIRYQRTLTDPSRHNEFDVYTGIKEYKDL